MTKSIFQSALIAAALCMTFNVNLAEAKKDKGETTESAESAESGEAAAEETEEAEEAEEVGTIEATNIPEVDSVFSQVTDLNTTLDEAETNLQSAEDNLMAALGAADGATLDAALADFKAQAGDALTVELDGTTPSLSVNPEAPEEIQAAVTGVQSAVGELQAVMAALQEAVAQATELGASVAAVAPTIPTAAKDAGLNVREIAAAVKTTKGNTAVTTATGARAGDLTAQATGLLSTVGSALTN